MESSSWPDHLPSDRRRAIDELVKGRDLTLKLRDLVHNNNNNNNNTNAAISSLNQDLVLNILKSFTNCLSILKRSYGESDEVSQVPTDPTHFTWDADVAVKSEDSEGSSKTTPTIKDRRGCYKRRKCSDSITNETSTLTDDGHAWRKYGQKVILNAKYPRNYFRCTHKHDQGCQATKQVQQIEENPPLYRSIYYGHHTCKNLLKASQFLLDSTSKDQSSMISFGNVPIADKQNHPFFSSFSSSVKQEYRDELPPSDHHNDPSSSSDHHYLLSPHDDQLTTLLSSDHGEVISGGNSSSSSLDMEVMAVESVNFDDDILQYVF
ncbi:hypothetical protein Patl1_31559 [Pistacia atlantica]|uniref:Uncharacterized protein n=1 Tax=Pistacia atlantica TaxID=434234 RepID=A0ACC1AN12_9ROSI|nr:hypothetical protein Patl1_31559 [Pistacia atlantica]